MEAALLSLITIINVGGGAVIAYLLNENKMIKKENKNLRKMIRDLAVGVLNLSKEGIDEHEAHKLAVSVLEKLNED